MKIATIIGSGFGLYGYLPALINAGAHEIILNNRYKEKFNSRKELIVFTPFVTWHSSYEEILEKVDTAVLAIIPDLQPSYAKKCISFKNITKLLLEKPLASNPAFSDSILKDLISSQKSFRIGYNFRFTHWYSNLFNYLNEFSNNNSHQKINLDWRFYAHHFAFNLNNWKRYHSKGGGVIRFYGIHLIAMLAELGYTEVQESRSYGENSEEIFKWSAIFCGRSLPEFHVCINTKSNSNLFQIQNSFGEKKINLISTKPSPFEQKDSIDPRIYELTELCKSFESLDFTDNRAINYYGKTNILWTKLEKQNLFIRKENY